MAGDHNSFQVRKILFARERADDRVHEIIRSQLSVVRGHPAGPPTIAPARPIHFVRPKWVATSRAVVRSKPGRDYNRVGKGVRQKCSRQTGAKIIISVAPLAMDDDQSSDNPIILLVQRIGAVDKRPCLIAETDPTCAVRSCGDAGFSSVSGNEYEK